MFDTSKGWPKAYVRGSTVYKKATWTNVDGEEEGAACIVCGDFVPDGALNMQGYYEQHELLHIAQGNLNLILHDIVVNGWVWHKIDEEHLPEGVKWKK